MLNYYIQLATHWFPISNNIVTRTASFQCVQLYYNFGKGGLKWNQLLNHIHTK